MTTISLLGNNINRYCAGLPKLPIATGEFGQVSMSSLPSLTGLNERGFWDQQNAASPFYGATSLTGFSLAIDQDGVTVLSGALQTIIADYTSKTAQVTVRGSMQAALERGCIYVSANPATPSTIVRELCEEYGIATDPGSFAACEAVFADANVSLYARFLAPDTSVLNAIEQVCQMTCSRVWAVNDVVFMDVYQTKTTSPLTTFTNRRAGGQPCTIWSPGGPTVTDLTKEPCEGFYVEWADTTNPASQGSDVAARKTISGRSDAALTITDFDTAVWIGGTWFDYLNRPQRQIAFGIPPWYGRQLALGYPVAIDFTRWNDPVTIDITGIDNTSPAVTLLTGVTR